MKKVFFLIIVAIASISVALGQFDPYRNATGNVPIPGTQKNFERIMTVKSTFGEGQPVYGLNVPETNSNDLLYNVVTQNGYIGLMFGRYLTIPCNRYTYFAPTWNARTYAIVAAPVIKDGKPVEKQYTYYTVVSALTGKETIPVKAIKYEVERDPLNDDPIFVAHLADETKRKFFFDGTEVTEGLPKEVKAFKVDDLYGIQSDGKVTANPQWLELAIIEGSRSFLAKMKDDQGKDRYGLVNHKGRVTVPLVFNEAEHLGTGVKFVKETHRGKEKVYMNPQGVSVSPIAIAKRNVEVTGHISGDPFGAKPITEEEMIKITNERIDKYNMETWGYDSKARRESLFTRDDYYELFRVDDINAE